jgi:hypothetical protein
MENEAVGLISMLCGEWFQLRQRNNSYGIAGDQRSMSMDWSRRNMYMMGENQDFSRATEAITYSATRVN